MCEQEGKEGEPKGEDEQEETEEKEKPEEEGAEKGEKEDPETADKGKFGPVLCCNTYRKQSYFCSFV